MGVAVGELAQRIWSNDPSDRRSLVDEEKAGQARPGHWFVVSALSFLRCFDTVG